MILACFQGPLLALSNALKADFGRDKLALKTVWAVLVSQRVLRKLGFDEQDGCQHQSARHMTCRRVSQHRYPSSIRRSSVKVQPLRPVIFQFPVGYGRNDHDKTRLSVFLA